MAVSPEAAEIIRRKKAQLCRYADTAQWNLIDTIALPDATFEYREAGGAVISEGGVDFSFSSRDALLAFLTDHFKDQQLIHTLSPGELEQTGPDEIKAIWGVTCHAGTKGAKGGSHATWGGFYYETWRRNGEDWFLATLRYERSYFKVLTLSS
jgi:hypothetical protein